jgi:hypothetical protein
MFSSGVARNVVWGLACVLFYTLGLMYTCFGLMDQRVDFGVVAALFGGIGWAAVLKWRKEMVWRFVGLALWVVIVVLAVGQLLVS